MIVVLLLSTFASCWVIAKQLGFSSFSLDSSGSFTASGVGYAVGDVAWKSCGFDGLPLAECGSITFVVPPTYLLVSPS